jgi:peroxiredoxin
LKVGDVAPDFTLRSHDGREITLSAFRGQRVVVAFFPFAFSNT